MEYSCDDVREELRAVALLELNGGGGGGGPADGENNNNDTLDLVQEAESAGGSRFILHLDGMKSASAAARQKDQHKQQQQQDDDDNDDNIITTNNTENEGGLRRRKGGEKINTTNDDISNKWTIEQQEQEQQSIIQDDEEEKHVRNCNANPLNLFGVPPPALRVAQSKSRSALAYYVEVANLAREILEITNNNDNDQS